MNNQYVFLEKDPLVSYIYKNLQNTTTLSVQKTLYFLYAYYFFIRKDDYPEELFPANFSAWESGPVDEEVYDKQKKDYYFIEDFFPLRLTDTQNQLFIKAFIDDLLLQINKINEWALMERSKEDNSWSLAFKEKRKLRNKEIKDEYKG